MFAVCVVRDVEGSLFFQYSRNICTLLVENLSIHNFVSVMTLTHKESEYVFR